MRQAANEHARSERVDIAPMFTKHRRRMLVEAQALHGRYVIYPFNGPGKTKVPTWGLVQFIGEQHYPRCLRVYYPTGQSFNVTLRGVRPYLQGVNSTPPAEVVITVPTTAAVVSVCAVQSESLPDYWDLGCFEALKAAQCVLMPGAWPTNLLLHRAQVLAGQPSLFCCSGDSELTGIETPALFKALDLSSVDFLVDLLGLAGQGTRIVPFTKVSDQVAPALVCQDPLQPMFWRSLLRASRRPDVVVCAPHPAAVDLVLPLFSSFAPCVCCLVPAAFLVDAPEPRVQWLRKMQSADRLQLLVCHSVFPFHGFVWVCVFTTAAIKNLFLHDAYKSCPGTCHIYLD